ncbi:MAG: hypothetical protein ACXWZZ_10770 [Solirubrobacteraceae bacterium]
MPYEPERAGDYSALRHLPPGPIVAPGNDQWAKLEVVARTADEVWGR